MSEHSEHHVVSYGTFTLIWLGLLVLTAITVGVAGIHLGAWNTIVAMGIASLKASLVLLYFMHLRYESKLFIGMVLLTIVTVTIIFILTFIDIPFR